MGKYLLGSIVVALIAFLVVNFALKNSAVSKKIDEAADVPSGEFDSLNITENSDGTYTLNLSDVKLFSSKVGTKIVCKGNIGIVFPREKDAKLVLKFRHNIAPMLAKPLRGMTPDEASTKEGEDIMVQSLKDGYAAQYNITTFKDVIFNDFSCTTSN
jgi:flagellar basal body-associated protein FliL